MDKDQEREIQVDIETITVKPEDLEKKERYVKKGLWKKIKKFAAKVPFVNDVVAMYYCAVDAKTPKWAKGVALGALAYFILPTDALPDILPVLGLTDDASAIAGAITALGKYVTDEHREKAKQMLTEDNPLD